MTMLRNATCILAVSLLTSMHPIRAADADSPLFTAFKTFCIDTNANPDAASAAVTAAGGRHREPGASTDAFSRTTTDLWDYASHGHVMIVSVQVRHISPIAKYPALIDVSCSVEDMTGDLAALDAARRWVGVPPDGRPSSVAAYTYVIRNGARVPGPTDRDGEFTARKSGGLWLLVATRYASTALHLSLSRSVAP